ncbi:winged helix-turn-helix transcriptional regulator [Ruegeria arenilitoris]|uniref:winged helix-turn-helix transcriptional regulator n=1 Tax=Ruegeria arenilitoris TaxID=1173585 RepID=UPI00147D3330
MFFANRLSKLETEGIFDREVDPRKASRICYFPTGKARDLLPALLNLMLWSTKYDENTEAPNSFAEELQKDFSGAVAWYETEIERVNSEIFSTPKS